MNSLRLAGWILVTLFRSGILPYRPDHWIKIVWALWQCGPSFAFLGQLAAARFPRREALRDDDGCLSFLQLQQQAQALARFLQAEEAVRAGQRVAIVFSNHRGFVLSLLALTRLGAHVLPLNPRLPQTVLRELLERQNIDLVLHESEASDKIGEGFRSRLWLDGLSSPGRLSRVRRAGQLIVLTSGSTGVSKGVVRRPTLAEVLPVTAGLLRDLPIEMHRPVILAIPFYHGYGIATLAMSLALGSSISTARRYDVSSLLARQSCFGSATLVTVPTLLWRWAQKATDSPQLAAVITGSAPLSAHLCRKLLEHFGPVLYNLYGATETGLIALATPSMLEAAPGCVGLPLPGNELRIEGDKIGEVKVRGPLVLGAGPDGWLKTGDLGRYDENGFLHICGRADGMIVSGGENVYPHELSDILADHPLLEDYAVLAVNDEEFGQRLVAAVVLKDSAETTESEIKHWLSERLERFKQPRHIYLLNVIPRNDLGKVQLKELKALLEV